jgi:hypothetical protein
MVQTHIAKYILQDLIIQNHQMRSVNELPCGNAIEPASEASIGSGLILFHLRPNLYTTSIRRICVSTVPSRKVLCSNSLSQASFASAIRHLSLKTFQ